MMRKRNYRGHQGGGQGGGQAHQGGGAEGKFKPRGKYTNRSGGGGGGDNAAKTIARATSMREKYMGLARDAQQAGDRIAAENWYQHADHYYRVIRAAQEDQEEFERYVNRTQPQGFEDEAPEEVAVAGSHLPAFLKGQPQSAPTGDGEGEEPEIVTHDVED